MASKKAKELIEKALGLNKIDFSEEALLDAVAPQKESAVVSIPSVAAPTIKTTTVTSKAHDIIFDESSKTYSLVTLEYTPEFGGKVVSVEAIGKSLPECSYKINKLFLDKLYPSIQRRKR